MPGLACIVGWLAVSRGCSRAPDTRDMRRLVLMGSVAAWCALVQFPFAPAVYFAFVAPLVILTFVAAAAITRTPSRQHQLVILVGYLAVGVVGRNVVYPSKPQPGPYVTIPLARGLIRISRADSAEYSQVVALLRLHSRSHHTLALPDAPELYFLSELDNPTRMLYDVFADSATDSSGRLMQLAHDNGITAIAINRQPKFSAPLSVALHDSLSRRFPESRTIGRFEIRWQAR